MVGFGKTGGRLTVVQGGRGRLARLLAVDLDGLGRGPMRLGSREALAFAHAEAAGMGLVVVTAADAAREPYAIGLGAAAVTVLPDGPVENDLTRGQVRADRLVAFCREQGVPLRDVAVIACRPWDCPMLLEVGMAVALETAGYDACSAADAVFPARGEGGLAAAVEAVISGLDRLP